MSNKLKVRRNRYNYVMRGNPRRGLLTKILMGLGFCALVFVGVAVYQPAYNFIMGQRSLGESPNIILSDPISDENLDDVIVAEPTAPVTVAAPAVDPDGTRAVFLPTATARDAIALDSFIAQLGPAKINTVLVDIKDTSGSVVFNTVNEKAIRWGAVSTAPYNLAALGEKLRENDIKLAVRLQVFRDPIASRANPVNAIRFQNSDIIWLDNTKDLGGKPWLNPYAAGTYNYISELAAEAAEAGASMVILDSFQFPIRSSDYATFGAESAGISRSEILKTFYTKLSAALGEKNVVVAAYLPATHFSDSYNRTTYYGGNPIEIFANGRVVVGALPYLFSKNYSSEGLSVQGGTENPAGAVSSVLGYIKTQTAAMGASAPQIVPLMQGGNEPGINAAPYTKGEIDAEIKAAADAGYKEYILYVTVGDYLIG